MTSQEIYTKLKDKFGDPILSFQEAVADSFIFIAPEAIADVARYLAEDSALAFDSLMCLSGVDLGAKESDFEVVYHLFSMTYRHNIVLKVVLPKEDSQVPTVEHIWKTANWHEREAFDMMGIKFSDHPDMKRILLPQDWEGHPLKKDYIVQDYYHGMYIPKDKTSWE